jgi:hypothetical protein
MFTEVIDMNQRIVVAETASSLDERGTPSGTGTARRTEFTLFCAILVLWVTGALVAMHVVAPILTMLILVPFTGHYRIDSGDILVTRLFFTAIALLVMPYALMRVLTPRFERKQLEQAIRAASVAPDHQLRVFSHVNPWVVIVPPLLMLPLGFGMVIFPVAKLAYLLGAVILTFAYVYHNLPNCRRSTKYLAFVVGSSSISTALVFGKNDVSVPALFWCAFCVLSWCAIFVVTWFRIQPQAALTRGEASTLLAINGYRKMMSWGPGPGAATLIWGILRCVPLLGDWFWSMRICCKEKLAQAPVLYLRSFSNPESSWVLGKAVAPAVGRTAVLATLVHPSQCSAALHRHTHPAWTATPYGVSNESWQDWYLRHLAGALAAIVDASVLTDSTRWELETAYKVLGRDRVAVISTNTDAHLFPGYLVFTYAADQPESLANPISHWIDWVVATVYGATANTSRELAVAGKGHLAHD